MRPTRKVVNFTLQDEQTRQDITDEQTVSDLPTENQSADTTEGQLPDSAKEQTKQEFEKLLAKNRELSEKLAQHEQQQSQRVSVLDSLNPSFNYRDLPQAQVEQITNSYVDADGYVDPALLNKALAEAREEARKANERAEQATRKVETFVQSQETKRVHEAFPALDPNSPEYDEKFWKAVRNEVLSQMMNGQEDLMKAAKDVATNLYDPSQKVKAQADEKLKQEVVSQRERASTLTSGARENSDPVDYDRLVQGSRSGDNMTIGERLTRSGY